LCSPVWQDYRAEHAINLIGCKDLPLNVESA